MSKPRRPKYQKQAPKAAATPVVEPTFAGEALPSAPESALDETAASQSEAALVFEAPDPASSEALAEILPAPVEDFAAVAPVPAAATISPRLLGAESFGTTVMNYVIGEGEAFAAHMRALAGARSMADFVRLQIGEIQRAADSTLTCWGMLAMSASRTVSPR